MAAQLRRELQTDVDMVKGHYGEFKVLVDGKTVVAPERQRSSVYCLRERKYWRRSGHLCPREQVLVVRKATRWELMPGAAWSSMGE